MFDFLVAIFDYQGVTTSIYRQTHFDFDLEKPLASQDSDFGPLRRMFGGVVKSGCRVSTDAILDHL